MKNVIKRITAVAMAFTMLCTGTAITKTISPQSVNFSVTASAACNHSCPYRTLGPAEYYRPKVLLESKVNWLAGGRIEQKYRYYQRNAVRWNCKSCGTVLYTTGYEYKEWVAWEKG